MSHHHAYNTLPAAIREARYENNCSSSHDMHVSSSSHDMHVSSSRYENNWDNAKNEEEKHPLKGIFRLNDIDPATVPRKDAGIKFFLNFFKKVRHTHTHTHTLIPPVYLLYKSHYIHLMGLYTLIFENFGCRHQGLGICGHQRLNNTASTSLFSLRRQRLNNTVSTSEEHSHCPGQPLSRDGWSPFAGYSRYLAGQEEEIHSYSIIP